MTTTQIQHVVPKEDKWAVRAANSEKPSKIFNVKMDAVAYAFDVTRKHDNGKVVIHNPDGSFKDVKVTEESSQLLSMLTA